MSDELRRYSDSLGEVTPSDPHVTEPMAPGSEADFTPSLPGLGPLTPLDPSPITPWEPGVDDGSSPLPGLDPSHSGDMVPGTVFPTPAGGTGGATGGGASRIDLLYETDSTLSPRPAPKQSCVGDYVTITAKNGPLKVVIYNGYINGVLNVVMPVQDLNPLTPITYKKLEPNESVTYTGCYTHWSAPGLADVTKYSAIGRLDGIDFSNL